MHHFAFRRYTTNARFHCTYPAVSQTGLRGNRAVDPDPLSVVSAMTRAYPLLLGPCWTQVAHVQHGLSRSADATLWIWLAQVRFLCWYHSQTVLALCCCCRGNCSTITNVQACTDGSLVTLVRRLPSQPQVASAYTKQAPMRCTQLTDLKAALLPLQVDSTSQLVLYMLC